MKSLVSYLYQTPTEFQSLFSSLLSDQTCIYSMIEEWFIRYIWEESSYSTRFIFNQTNYCLYTLPPRTSLYWCWYDWVSLYFKSLSQWPLLHLSTLCRNFLQPLDLHYDWYVLFPLPDPTRLGHYPWYWLLPYWYSLWLFVCFVFHKHIFDTHIITFNDHIHYKWVYNTVWLLFPEACPFHTIVVHR